MDVTDTGACYRAVKSRDPRFDGVFYTAVRTTGIYCRPSCPAVTPQRKNVAFFRTAAAAQQAGYRACRRCLPDATPGSPEWDVGADAVGRAMRLVSDGVVEREGVPGLARALGYSPRHLGRLLAAELGAGPLALSRARRAQTARILIETTALPFADIAFAAGFASIRQFNDTVRAVYARTPTQLRGARRSESAAARQAAPGRIDLRLAVRAPFHASSLLAFLAVRAVEGVEEAGPATYARAMRLPHGAALVRLAATDNPSAEAASFVRCSLWLQDLRDLAAAVERCRRLVDADCDPLAVDDELGADHLLAPLVRRRPGLRVPGHVDGAELAVRAVVGQQVSVAAARTLTSRLVERYGEPLPVALEAAIGDTATPRAAEKGPTALSAPARLFPRPEVLAAADPDDLPLPRARARAVVALSTAVADGRVRLDRSAPRDEVSRALQALPGIGPWTSGYIAMRALGDPDAALTGDAGVRAALTRLGRRPADPEPVVASWRPWRSYAQLHLWASLGDDDPTVQVPTPGPGARTKEA